MKFDNAIFEYQYFDQKVPNKHGNVGQIDKTHSIICTTTGDDTQNMLSQSMTKSLKSNNQKSPENVKSDLFSAQ